MDIDANATLVFSREEGKLGLSRPFFAATSNLHGSSACIRSVKRVLHLQRRILPARRHRRPGRFQGCLF